MPVGFLSELLRVRILPHPCYPWSKIPVSVSTAITGTSLSSQIAVIEMAQASGLALWSAPDRDVWRTDTRGTGELIAVAAARGVCGILLGAGGSATNDFGPGALTALDAKPHEISRRAVPLAEALAGSAEALKTRVRGVFFAG